MWQLAMTAKRTASRPSDLAGIEDRWAALQFDYAVNLVGVVIENAGQEQENYGSEKKPKYGPKYSMETLLDPEFRLPRPRGDRDRQRDFINRLKAMAGRQGSGVGHIRITE